MIEDLARRLQRDGQLTMTIRVRSGAPRTQFRGIMEDGRVKVDLVAVSEDGRANAELVRFLAEAFRVPKANVTIVSGQTCRRKTVCIRTV